TEFITAKSERSATDLSSIESASSNVPSTLTIVAPYTAACTILPAATFPAGTMTAAPNPALAAYADIEADVLPVEAQTSTLTPDWIARVTETVIPLSLKEPVGFCPS